MSNQADTPGPVWPANEPNSHAARRPDDAGFDSLFRVAPPAFRDQTGGIRIRSADQRQPSSDSTAKQRRGPKRKTAILGAAILLVAASGGALAWGVGRPGNHGASTGPAIGFAASSQDPATAAQQTAHAFLTAWTSGDIRQAADYTDRPAPALTALNAFHRDLRPEAISTSTQQSAASGLVTYSVTLRLARPAPPSASTPSTPPTGAAATTAAWTYNTQLRAYAKAGRWYVQWQPSVLAPGLTAATHLQAVLIPPPPGPVTDAAGGDLSNSTDPGLSYIAALLAKNPPPGQGTPGLQIEIQTADGTPAAGTTPTLIAAPGPASAVRTTIQPAIEAAAQSAAGMYQRSAMVVIRPSTGDILAIANHDGLNHTALTGRVAPGSTFKVVTSAALFNEGAVTTSQIVQCPAAENVQGVVFHNDNNSQNLGKPFIDDFAQSCNNAFDSQYTHLQGGLLATTATNYFGLNRPWDIGLGDAQSYSSIPKDAAGAELAQECFGQGQLLVSPLAMASIAATVDAGHFNQPVLLPATRRITATPLPSATDNSLKLMMRAVITYPDGTGYGIGFGPGVYAKTGTADVGSTQSQPNSWMIAFDPGKDVAVAALVQDAGYGASYAGPEVKRLLSQLK